MQGGILEGAGILTYFQHKEPFSFLELFTKFRARCPNTWGKKEVRGRKVEDGHVFVCLVNTKWDNQK